MEEINQAIENREPRRAKEQEDGQPRHKIEGLRRLVTTFNSEPDIPELEQLLNRSFLTFFSGLLKRVRLLEDNELVSEMAVIFIRTLGQIRGDHYKDVLRNLTESEFPMLSLRIHGSDLVYCNIAIKGVSSCMYYFETKNVGIISLIFHKKDACISHFSIPKAVSKSALVFSSELDKGLLSWRHTSSIN